MLQVPAESPFNTFFPFPHIFFSFLFVGFLPTASSSFRIVCSSFSLATSRIQGLECLIPRGEVVAEICENNNCIGKPINLINGRRHDGNYCYRSGCEAQVYVVRNSIRLFVAALAQHSARFGRWLIIRHNLNPDWTAFFTGLLGCIL
jgi:hypothetical protein